MPDPPPDEVDSENTAAGSSQRVIRVGALARVEGEGSLTIRRARWRGGRRAASNIRGASVFRGIPAGPCHRRGSRHHRSDLWNLPGGLPDERVPRSGGDSGS